VLDLAAQEWLQKRDGDADDAARQRRLQRAATACFGNIAGGHLRRAESAREAIRERLRRKHER
jgi:hypothetical protein